MNDHYREVYMYILTNGKIFGGILKKVFFFSSQNVDGFRQNDSQDSEYIKLNKQNTFEIFFIFIIYQNYILALIPSNL